MTTQPAITPGLRFLLSAACLVIVVAGLRAASAILVPLALALFVAVVSLPLLNIVRRQGIPTGLAILFVVLFDAAALFMFGWLVSLAAMEIRQELPLYIDRLREMEVAWNHWFAMRGIPGVSPFGATFEPERLVGLVTLALGWATNIITMVFMVILIFVFMLAEASSFPRKLRAVIRRDPQDLGRSAKIVGEIQHYLAIKTMISVTTGLTIGVVTWGLGLDFPLLWGLTAFLLNYIPNVGSIIAAIPAVIVALLQIGPGMAVIVAAVYIGVNAVFGSFLEPMLVGHQLGISTLVIILSLIFWGWMWGPVGMFLAVPLTMAVKIGLENTEEFRWIAVLMTAERRDVPLGPVAVRLPREGESGYGA
jgi:AI-2 transport protein TqsA